MKLRIAIWAATGAFVVAFWSHYFVLNTTHPGRLEVPWTLVDLTIPIALLRHASHYPMSMYFVLFANACIYALVGAFVEIPRRLYRQHPPRRFAN
jgi:hypothetical protein